MCVCICVVTHSYHSILTGHWVPPQYLTYNVRVLSTLIVLMNLARVNLGLDPAAKYMQYHYHYHYHYQ